MPHAGSSSVLARVERRVREHYAEHPYPDVSGRVRGARWNLPPLAWIADVWPRVAPARRPRILVAGCGTGGEAFTFQDRFPNSEIIAVDFCPSSIKAARRQQEKIPQSGIRFAVADLTGRRFGAQIGGTFDLISCHGVLSYVPRLDLALSNLARAVGPAGVLYLGVNGSSHFSTRWRSVLPEFGIAIDQMPSNDAKLTKVLALLNAAAGENIAAIARQERSFLATDLFGPLIRTCSLRQLLEACRNVGLHFLGAYEPQAPFRSTVNNESYTALIPRSRAAVAELLDTVAASRFHRLLVSKDATPAPPWSEPEDLARWRPLATKALRESPLPKRRGWGGAMQTLTIKNPLLEMQLELRTKRWIDALRGSRGEKSLGALVRQAGGSIRNATLRKHLFLLHQLYLLNFRSPESPDSAR